MSLRVLFRLLFLLSLAAPIFAAESTFRSEGVASKAAWAKIFATVGVQQTQSADAGFVVITAATGSDVEELAQKRFVILEGTGPAASKLGIEAKGTEVATRQICDKHAPKTQIIWKQPIKLQTVSLPGGFEVFAWEKWKNNPVLAGKRTAHGAILWTASDPGPTGTERYPYLLQALVDLGFQPALQAANLWAFFDSSYRIRADVDYLATRWRKAGIGVLHVAAWHNMEPGKTQDEYLKALIEACHRQAILVYAWLELPHVSEQFWTQHPAWREKTALGQDAMLDWRKLMNLQNADCRQEAVREISLLLNRFDWDGVNVAELYFESLEGASNPARFTPMNDDVRAEFRVIGDFDPKLLFDPESKFSANKNPQALRKFLEFRAHLASRMQTDWLDVIDGVRQSKPYLATVLTHIDDRFEPEIRDALGADVARSLPAVQARHSMLLVEDPATLWDLGADRYAKLAEKYGELKPASREIGVDINVVERYQDVYPTKKQTGVELLELVHQAAASFSRVALYFENSLEKQDLALLPSAAAAARVTKSAVDEIEIEGPESSRIAWQGLAELDGKPWPIRNADFVLAPAGRHRLSVGTKQSPVELADFNGEIQSIVTSAERVDVSYAQKTRAVVILASPASKVELDGTPLATETDVFKTGESILLPAGQHIVTFVR